MRRVLLSLFLALAACTPANLAERPSAHAYQYTLGSGDRLKVETYGEQRLTGEFAVNGEGKVSFPLLGEVEAPQAGGDHLQTAFERFGENGPLALLPLPQSRRWALVWCDRADRCETRRADDPARLSAELQSRVGDRLGPLEVCGPLGLARLSRRARRQVATPNAVWIGNAAQSLHPVAGQGLNLGLRDAFELADSLADLQRSGSRLPDALQSFERRRRADRLLTIGLTDLMAESFTWPLIRPLQSGVLGTLDMLSALRAPLARQLMFGRR